MTSNNKPILYGINAKLNGGKDYAGEYIASLYQQFAQEQLENVKFAGKLKQMVALILGVTVEKLEDRDYKNAVLPEKWWVIRTPDYKVMLPYSKEMVKRYDLAIEYGSFIVVKMTPRIMMQLMGTEAGRNIIHPNVWVNATFSDFSENSKWFITDMRFRNEMEAVKEHGGITIRIDRPYDQRHPEVVKELRNSGFDVSSEYKFLNALKVSDKKEHNELYDVLVHPSELGLDDDINKFDYVIDNSKGLAELQLQLRDIVFEQLGTLTYK